METLVASTARPNEGRRGRTVPTEAGLFQRTRLREGNQDFFLSLCKSLSVSWRQLQICIPPISFYLSLSHTLTNTNTQTHTFPLWFPCFPASQGRKHSVVNVAMVKAEWGQRMATMCFMWRDLEPSGHPGCTVRDSTDFIQFFACPRCLFLNLFFFSAH